MKGLLIKDWIIIKKYCKSLVFIILVYIAIEIFGVDPGNGINGFIAAYIPVGISMTTLAVDERSRWLLCVDALPIDRKTVVSSKYIMSGTLVLLCAILFSLISLFRADAAQAAAVFAMQIAVGFTVLAASMPATFKFGVDKARYINIALVVATLLIIASIGGVDATASVRTFLPAAISCVLLALSWLLSVIIFNKIEICRL